MDLFLENPIGFSLIAICYVCVLYVLFDVLPRKNYSIGKKFLWVCALLTAFYLTHLYGIEYAKTHPKNENRPCQGMEYGDYLDCLEMYELEEKYKSYNK